MKAEGERRKAKVVPPELVRRGITGATHDLPAGMEVNCARDLALIFGEEIKAHLLAKADGRSLNGGRMAEVSCETLHKLPSI